LFQRSLLSDADVELLAEGVYTVLENIGMICQNKEMLKALKSKGAKVDYALNIVTFPREMQEEFVEQLKKENVKRENSGHEKFQSPGLPGLGTQVAQFFYDDKKRERRSGNKKDFISLIKLGDVLHPDAGVGHSLLLTDVPPILEPLEAAVLLAEYAHKPGPCFAWNVKQVKYLKEMGKILGFKDWYTLGGTFIAHPLRFDRDVADRYVYRIKAGYGNGVGTMPVAGVSTPVTTAGFIVVTSAEILAAWMAARALDPKVALSASVWAGTIDMKTGEVSYSAFDGLLNGVATAEFIRRWCGIRISVGSGTYCSAKKPGLYAALEKAYKAMIIAAFTGHHPGVGDGMIDNGKTLSPVQLLLERDLVAGIQFLGRSVEVTPETISLETILDVGHGLRKNHLQMRHTLRHYRESLWIPELIDRSGWDGFDKEEEILEKTQKKVDELISAYEKPEVDQDKLYQMRQIVKRAQKELGTSRA